MFASHGNMYLRRVGATPISHFLGAIVSGSQGALIRSAKEMNLQVGHVKWHATGKYDLRGMRGEEVSSPHCCHQGLLELLGSKGCDLAGLWGSKTCVVEKFRLQSAYAFCAVL